MGHTLGGELILNDKTEIEIIFFELGKHEFDGEWEEGNVDGKIDDLAAEVSYTTITIGFKI